jgi:hypothetical protein
MPLFLFFNTQTMHIKPITGSSIAIFSLNTLAGFEPGSSVPKADTLSAAHCRKGNNSMLLYLHTTHFLFVSSVLI